MQPSFAPHACRERRLLFSGVVRFVSTEKRQQKQQQQQQQQLVVSPKLDKRFVNQFGEKQQKTAFVFFVVPIVFRIVFVVVVVVV